LFTLPVELVPAKPQHVAVACTELVPEPQPHVPNWLPFEKGIFIKVSRIGSRLKQEFYEVEPNWFPFNQAHFPSQFDSLRTVDFREGLVENAKK